LKNELNVKSNHFLHWPFGNFYFFIYLFIYLFIYFCNFEDASPQTDFDLVGNIMNMTIKIVANRQTFGEFLTFSPQKL